jgi:hypothetical protein
MSRRVVILAGVLLGSVALACNGLVDEGQLYGGWGGPDDGGGTRSDASTGGNTPPPWLQAPIPDSGPLQPANACNPAPPGSDASCYASCCTPAGTIEPYTSVDQLYSSLLGKWQFCTGIENWQWLGAPTDAIGVEFAPSSTPPPTDGGPVSGDMYFLVQGSSGPVRGTSADYQGSYGADRDAWYSIGLYGPNGHNGWSTTVLYSPCPTELDITSIGYNNGGVLVPFY